jgi:hypothetical protein
MHRLRASPSLALCERRFEVKKTDPTECVIKFNYSVRSEKIMCEDMKGVEEERI